MSFVYSYTIRLSDTDAAGVVYFANILTIFHEAYEEFLAAEGIDLNGLIQEGSVALPIARCSLNCLKPLVCGDRVLVNLALQSLRDRGFELSYEVVAQSDPKIISARGSTRHVCIDPQKRLKVALPKQIARSLQSLPHAVEQ
ncbi:acyl-CoA thioesterase [Lusitaniella coriacea LEGE 07157]|uniref:Acyl-CoA thioesterase n=1 Tax=Lusitaniella coriacea LEGE 07157 TaxID=945747 RepID=A0A8J7DNW6_9CYAN|nr:thioesterase family protein [Lusitaniella coriacea]MBE9115284.1 acyl-CoA thioesterase [Lusitaniella coriacea LEGE 07157]